MTNRLRQLAEKARTTFMMRSVASFDKIVFDSDEESNYFMIMVEGKHREICDKLVTRGRDKITGIWVKRKVTYEEALEVCSKRNQKAFENLKNYIDSHPQFFLYECESKKYNVKVEAPNI
jgi:hypothetical protein